MGLSETVRRAGKPVSIERIDGGDSGWTWPSDRSGSE